MATQPRQALEDTLARRRARRLDLPCVILGHDAQVQRIRHFFRLHAAVDVLLVGKDEEQRVFHFAVLDDARQLRLGFFNAVAVVAVDDEDEALGA